VGRICEVRGCRALIDVAQGQIVDSEGGQYSYERLLLATGGSPRRLPFGDGSIIYFRNLADYRRLRALTDEGDQFAVIGGGFIGSEIAAALAMNGKRVVMVFPEAGIGALDPAISPPRFPDFTEIKASRF
jgi:3-phenylpropionate/trans-cinnamate dioxygenase ferredoxin reductase component